MSESWAWPILQSYGANEQQRVWIKRELELSPPRVDQEPYQWLLWRSKISEGMNEDEAWQSVLAEQVRLLDGPAGGDEDMMFSQSEADDNMAGNHDFTNQVAADPTFATYPSGVQGMGVGIGGEVKPSLQAGPQPVHNYVQMNDILPLPNNAIPYDGTLDPSGLEFSGSSDGDSAGEEDMEMEIEPVQNKPSITALPRAGPPGSLLGGLGSASQPYNLVSPQNSQINSRATPPSLAPSLRAIAPAPPIRPQIQTTNAVASSSKPTPPAQAARPRSSKSRSPPKSATLPPGAAPTLPPAPAPVPPAAEEIINMATVRPLLSRERLRHPDVQPGKLWKYLRRLNDGSEPRFQPNPSELKEIMTALHNNAPPSYKEEMVDNWKYSEQIASWLKTMRKDPILWEPAIAPTILLLAGTNMALNVFTDLKVGKLVRALVDKARKAFHTTAETSKGTKMEPIESAYIRYQDFCKNKIITAKRTIRAPGEPTEASIKRKREETAESDQAGQADKKPIINAAGKAVPAGKTARPANAAATGRPTTSTTAASSAKPKPMSAVAAAAAAAIPAAKRQRAFPPIKKRDSSDPLPTAPSPTTPSAPPTSLLAATLARARQAVSAIGDSGDGAAPLDARENAKVKLNKKGHSVKFSDVVEGGRPLVAIREFQREAKEFEPVPWDLNEDGSEIHGMSAHDMEMKEGMSLKKDIAGDREDSMGEPEKIIDWYDPPLFDDSPLPEPTPEAIIQEARERGILASAGGLPPDETKVHIVPATPGCIYQLYPDYAMPAQQPVTNTVSQLLSSLGSLPLPNLSGLTNHFGAPPPPPPGNFYPHGAQGWQQHQQQVHPGPSYSDQTGYPIGPPPPMTGQQGWQGGAGGYGSFGTNPGPSYRDSGPGHSRSSDRGWGGPAQDGPSDNSGPSRGRGGGGKRKGRGTPEKQRNNVNANSNVNGFMAPKLGPCKYFSFGRCDKGNDCAFSHE